MARDLNDMWGWIQKLVRRVSRLESGAMLENSSITNGRMRFIGGTLRVDSGGRVEIVGTLEIDGTTTVTGTFKLTGHGWEISGNGTISGNLIVTGLTTLNGDVTLNNDLTLGSGRFVAGPLIIDKAGGYGARVYSTGTLLLDASSNVVIGANAQALGTLHSIGDLSTNANLSVLGNSTVVGAKSFRMPHPLKDEHWLQHGCTESPISGTEYTGRATIGEDGSAVVELPDYFEALNKEQNRTVQVTSVGRPFAVGADEVVDGKVTVYGDPGRDVFWLVKAERTGGDFETEAPIPAAPVNYD